MKQLTLVIGCLLYASVPGLPQQTDATPPAKAPKAHASPKSGGKKITDSKTKPKTVPPPIRDPHLPAEPSMPADPTKPTPVNPPPQ